MITIFTPTFNRAYIIGKLFDSLCSQSCLDFEWLVVDDGSTDETEQLFSKFQIQKPGFEIHYIKQINGGKHRAINRGVKEAKGELFFIVDSDDRLTPDAIEWISRTYKDIKEDASFAGISGTRITPDGHRIGGDQDFGIVDTDSLSFRFVNKISGDLAEVYKTDILRMYPFLEIEGEKFCPEALVWNRISQSYKLRFCNHGIYVCAYLSDGLTAKITKLRHQSPVASMTYYSELHHLKIDQKQKLKSMINFWRFAHCRMAVSYNMINLYSILGLPMGLLYAVYDFIKKQV